MFKIERIFKINKKINHNLDPHKVTKIMVSQCDNCIPCYHLCILLYNDNTCKLFELSCYTISNYFYHLLSHEKKHFDKYKIQLCNLYNFKNYIILVNSKIKYINSCYVSNIKKINDFKNELNEHNKYIHFLDYYYLHRKKIRLYNDNRDIDLMDDFDNYSLDSFDNYILDYQ